MFKKISLLAGGVAAAEYGGSPVIIQLCTKQTVDRYTASIICHDATITLEGKDAVEENDKTDGYQATMKVSYLKIITSNVISLYYGVCVVPVAMTGDDATDYQKKPQGMCLGICTAGARTVAKATDWASDEKDNQVGLLGGHFGYIGYADLVTGNALSTKTGATWTDVEIATVGSDANIDAQKSSTLKPNGLTTMNKVTTYGNGTATDKPVAAWYDDAANASFYGTGYVDDPIDDATTPSEAVFYMPTESDSYNDVPRLSPADTDGWQAYAPALDTDMGKMKVQIKVTNDTIVTNFATTIAAGIAFVGAAALSF